jgi:drug/metabolite transporter (DMT)-like permease
MERSAKGNKAGAAAIALALLLEVALVLSWSAGFVGIRFAIDYAPIFSILLWRSLVSGLLLLPFALALGPRLQRKEVRSQMAYGALAMSGYLGCFAFSIAQGVPTGLVALITDMLPLVVALLSWPVLGLALSGRQWVGTFIGLSGVVVASGITTPTGDVALWAYLLPVLGTAALALATLLQKGHASNAMPVYQKLCIQCLSAAAIFALPAWLEGSVLPVFNTGFMGGILWLVFVATFGAWGLYYLALRHTSAARVTAILYLSPPVTMVWAWALFNEPLSWAMAAGLAISLLGIVVFASAQRRFSSTESR